MHRLTVAIPIGLAACTYGYQPGSFSDGRAPFAGARLTLGCVDLAVQAPATTTARTLIAYRFGNRCTHRVVIDLATVRVVARDADGHDTPLRAYDPRHEIAPAELGALLDANETIEYRGAEPHAATICADLGGVDASVARSERWICMVRS